MVRFTLVLVMLFSLFFFYEATCEIIDRVLFYVDNQAVTLRDFNKFSTEIKKKVQSISNQDIIDLMINRTLMIKNAKELFLEGTDDEIINNLIDFRIKSKIIITENQIRDYYEKNRAKFGERSYQSLREEIEKYLFERELNSKLKEFIEELRKNSDIKVIFIP